MKNRDLHFYFIILFCISSIDFFRPIFISSKTLDYIYYAFFLSAFLIIFLTFRSSEKNVFATPIFLILISILISAFFAAIYWYQSLIYSYVGVSYYLSYILFFLLIVWKVHVKDIEKIIIILGLIYIIGYTISLYLFPFIIFGSEGGLDRGFQTIVLSGTGFLFLFSFYSLSQYLGKRQFLWLVIFFISMIFIIMLLVRTLIIVSFILLTLYILRMSSFIKKIIAILLVGCFVYIITQFNFFQLLVNQTKNQTENVGNDIRVLSARFYLTDFSPEIFNKIFGNGEPAGGSNYSRYSYYLENELGFFQSDIGYIGLYSKFGILAILGYLILIFRTYKISVPSEYLYCKYYLYFIFLISVIIDAPFNNSFIPSIVLAIYVLHSKELSRTDNKENSVL